MKRTHKIAGFIMLCLFLHGMALHADLYNRAPDVLPGTLPEMREPLYWIGQMDDPDGIILTADEIVERNDAYIRRMSADDRFEDIHPGRVPDEWQLNRWPCRFFVRPDIVSMRPSEISVMVKERIRECIEYVRASKYGNYLAVEYSEREIDEFIGRMGLESVPDEPVIRDGIAVCTTQLRIVPTFFPAEVGLTDSGSGNYSIDKWTSNVVKIGRPVTILHRSVNGSHVFVLSEDNFGWVDARDIAFGHHIEIREYGNTESFLICTGNRVPFYSDKRCEYVSGWLAMGDKVPTGSADEPRIIQVPVRNTTGKFSTETAWLAEDADVHTGLVPYTRRNIIEIAFKLLDDPYDWTMSTLGRNHETTYRDIFACFGFRLPHNGGLFTLYGNKDVAAMPDMGKDRQLAMVMENEPFISLVVSRGHAMLYLGEHNGEPVGFDQNGYGYTDDDGVRFEVKRCSIIDTSIIGYFLKNPITFLELK